MIEFSKFKSLISLVNYFITNEKCKQAIIESRCGKGEEYELKPLQKVIDTVEEIFFDIDNLDDMITDLVHERSVEYYQRYWN